MRAFSAALAFSAVMLAAEAIAGDINSWWLLLAGLMFGAAWGVRDA